MLDIAYAIAGLSLLILGGNFLLKGSVDVSLRLSIPKIVVGMTVVSFVTSAPELIVSLDSALRGYPDLALSNVVGSNIANLGLVLGLALLLGQMDVRRSFYVTDWPVMMAASLLFFVFVYGDLVLGRTEGVVMIATLFLFLLYLLRFQKPAIEEALPEVFETLPLYKTVFYLGAGGIALWGGSELLITGAIGLANLFHVSERFIGITVVSVGTSIPELAASVIAMLKKERAISVGNLIGSNIFNLLAVLGITAVVQPIEILDPRLIEHDIFWLLGISFLLLPLVFFPKQKRLDWKDGLILLVVYGFFLFFTY
ncbi:MAG: calcium/sodium antiporter [Robiginitalea sp.]|nr:calcium/sodium antiporter [Robiginitalea sp.]